MQLQVFKSKEASEPDPSPQAGAAGNYQCPYPRLAGNTTGWGRTCIFPPCWGLLPYPLLPNSGFLSLFVAQTVPYSQSLGTNWRKGVGGCHLWWDWAAEQSLQRHIQSFQRKQTIGEISKYWSFEAGIKTSSFNSIHYKFFLNSYLKHTEKNSPKCAGQSSFLPQFQHHWDPCTAPACPAPASWISMTFFIAMVGGKANKCSYQSILLTLQSNEKRCGGVGDGSSLLCLRNPFRDCVRPQQPLVRKFPLLCFKYFQHNFIHQPSNHLCLL